MSAARAPRNLAASIHQRLLDLARARGEDFQLLLDRYAVERLLYRLSVSEARDDFVLKGALLFAVWFDAPHRPTRDADFLGFGPADAVRLAETVRQVCAIDREDGIAHTTPRRSRCRRFASRPITAACASTCEPHWATPGASCNWT